MDVGLDEMMVVLGRPGWILGTVVVRRSLAMSGRTKVVEEEIKSVTFR